MLKTLTDSTGRIQALGTTKWSTDRVLIIKERSNTNVTALNEAAPDKTHRLTADSDQVSLRREILAANNDNTWLIADIEADLSPDSVTVVKEISRGAVHGEDGNWHDLTANFRLIAVIDRAKIDEQSYPHFLNLFDTAISLS